MCCLTACAVSDFAVAPSGTVTRKVRVARLTTRDNMMQLTGSQRQGDTGRSAKPFFSALSNRPHSKPDWRLLNRNVYLVTQASRPSTEAAAFALLSASEPGQVS